MNFISFLGVLFYCCFNLAAQEFGISDFEGTWKHENSETFEVWTNQNDIELVGVSYKMTNGNKKVSENLKLSKLDNKIQYSAQVMNQNNAKWISFELNPTINEKLSFENLEHDFPKKIQYTFVNSEKIFVEVKGEKENGFSFYLIKIKE